MINPNFDPTWLLDMAKESEKHFKETLALMLEANREEQAELERERIIKLIEDVSAEDEVTWNTSELIKLIKGEYCECDHCDDKNCSCYGKKCDFCKEKEN